MLRRYLGPRFDRNLPSFLARAIMERMRLSKWRITKEQKNTGYGTAEHLAALAEHVKRALAERAA